MKQTRILVLVGPLLASILCANLASGFSSGPPDGRTNAPGEGNCTACHTSFPLNSGSGMLEVLGLPQQYVPGALYPVQIRLSDPVAQRWGFEFTILDAQGVSAGALAPVDGNTQLSSAGLPGRTYAKHTSAGTNFGQTGQNVWTVDWTAPAAGTGGVGLFVAGNAANGNFANSGDRIYATSWVMSEGTISGVPAAALAARLHPGFPNPFNPRTVLSFSLEAPAAVALAVYDLRGSLVDEIHAGPVEAGTHRFVWQGTDRSGQAMPSGLYFARLTDGGGRDLATPVKLTLAR